MVVGVSPPAKRAAPRRADRFGATADTDPGHRNITETGGACLCAEGRHCRAVNAWVEGFGHRSGGLQLDVREPGRFHDKLASTNTVADVSPQRFRLGPTAVGLHADRFKLLHLAIL